MLCAPLSKSLANGQSVAHRRPAGQAGWACHDWRQDYRASPMVEPGLVTLAKIVGTLLLAMGIIPFLFLLSPGGDKNEPKDNFDDLV